MPILSPKTLALHHRPHSLPLSSSLVTVPSSSHFSPVTISPLSSSSPTVSINTMESKKTQQSRGGGPPFVTRASASASEASSYSEAIGEILGDVSIFTAAGEQVAFKDLWDQKEGMAVVALLRHFGCPCCWELASALKASKERFDSAGVKLIAVGVGTPSKAQILAERLPFPLDCLYCDPDRKAYDVLGLYYGFGRTFFSPASAKVFSRFGTLREAVKNYTIKATPDDRSGVLQQGGIYVFKGKQLLYSRKDEGTGDHAPLNEILDICCTVSVA